MRSSCVMAVLILLTACAAAPDVTTACTEPRPQVCTMEFLPTCAALATGGSREFTSPCTACADPAVTGYFVGSCPK